MEVDLAFSRSDRVAQFLEKEIHHPTRQHQFWTSETRRRPPLCSSWMVLVRVAPDQTSFVGHGWVWTTLDMLSELLTALLQSLDKVYSRLIGFHPSSGVGKTLVDVNSFKVNLCQIAFILVLLFIVFFWKQQKKKTKKQKKNKRKKIRSISF